MDIVWANPAWWENFFPRKGGIHMLMSFVGCIGTLMKNSGLEELMRTSFSGVEKMLIGKKFPMNVRALRIVVIEIVRGHIDPIVSYEDKDQFPGCTRKKKLLS